MARSICTVCCCFFFSSFLLIFTFISFILVHRYHQSVCHVSKSILLRFVYRKSYWGFINNEISERHSLGAWLFVRTSMMAHKYIPSNTWIMMIINKIWRGIFTDGEKYDWSFVILAHLFLFCLYILYIKWVILYLSSYYFFRCGKTKSFYLLHYNDFSFRFFFVCVIWRKVFIYQMKDEVLVIGTNCVYF